MVSASDELPPLAAVWSEEKSNLASANLREFQDRLQREWAIETGVIERVYSLGRGTTELLIERGIEQEIAERGITFRSARHELGPRSFPSGPPQQPT